MQPRNLSILKVFPTLRRWRCTFRHNSSNMNPLLVQRLQLCFLLTALTCNVALKCTIFHNSTMSPKSTVPFIKISLPWVIYFKAFYLHVVSSFSCILVICPKLVLFLNPLQFVHLFCNLNLNLNWCPNCVCGFHNSAFTVFFRTWSEANAGKYVVTVI